MRSAFNLLAGLSVALVVYMFFSVLIVNRVMRVTCGVTAARPPAPFVSGGRVNILGRYVPIPIVLAVVSFGPTWLVIAATHDAVRRRNRERRGQCLECGATLRSPRGRCPGCGIRYEQSLPRDRHFAMPVLPVRPRR